MLRIRMVIHAFWVKSSLCVLRTNCRNFAFTKPSTAKKRIQTAERRMQIERTQSLHWSGTSSPHAVNHNFVTSINVLWPFALYFCIRLTWLKLSSITEHFPCQERTQVRESIPPCYHVELKTCQWNCCQNNNWSQESNDKSMQRLPNVKSATFIWLAVLLLSQ